MNVLGFKIELTIFSPATLGVKTESLEVFHMAQNSEPAAISHCWNCGFEAPAGSDEWERLDAVSIGTLTRCPECGSTDVSSGR